MQNVTFLWKKSYRSVWLVAFLLSPRLSIQPDNLGQHRHGGFIRGMPLMRKGDITGMANRAHPRPRGNRPAKYRLLMVAMGIVLFVAGFVLTLTSLSDETPTRVQGTYEGSEMGRDINSQAGIWIIAGFVLSLAGLVLATVGPAVSYLRAL